MSGPKEQPVVRYLTAQTDDEYFRLVKIKLAERGMTMRDAIVLGLNTVLNIDHKEEKKDE